MGQFIQGVYAAAVTPRREGTCEIDAAAALEGIDFLCGHCVDGIALLGTTGEFVHFSNDQRAKLAHLAIRRSRVPVLVNVSHSSLDGAVELGQQAMDDGAAGLLIMPPYYFRYDQQEIAHFFFRFYGEMASETPILLYNIPQYAPEIAIDTAQALLSSEFFAGIKISGGGWDYVQRLLEQRLTQPPAHSGTEHQPFSVMLGIDDLYARARALGAQGAVSGVAGALPELVVALDKAVLENRQERIEYFDQKLKEFLRWVEALPAPIAIREAASLRGLKTGPLPVPLSKEGGFVLSRFREWFTNWLPEVVREAKC